MALVRFVKRHVVLCISAACAIATMCVVPPDTQYWSYIDWETIGCLFCVLAVANAFRRIGAFDYIARVLLEKLSSPRGVVAMLVATTGVLSMFATNDMALIVMLPVAATALAKAGCCRLIPHAFVLQGLSANLCGMIMPFGNPQNLFLYSYFSLGLGDFLATLMPFFLTSVVLLAVGTWFLTRGAMSASEPVSVDVPALVRMQDVALRRAGQLTSSGHDPAVSLTFASASRRVPVPASVSAQVRSTAAGCSEDAWGLGAMAGRGRIVAYTALLVLSLLAVFRVVPVFVAVMVVGLALLLADRDALKAVDYPLLVTFVCFFVFAGNIGRVPHLDVWLASAVQGGELLVSVALSQVISNVPAAVLLSHFTGDWAGILVGVNIGGAGTLVGSLANLITLQHFMRIGELAPDAKDEKRLSLGYFMKVFTLMNAIFLAILLAQGMLLGR